MIRLSNFKSMTEELLVQEETLGGDRMECGRGNKHPRSLGICAHEAGRLEETEQLLRRAFVIGEAKAWERPSRCLVLPTVLRGRKPRDGANRGGRGGVSTSTYNRGDYDAGMRPGRGAASTSTRYRAGRAGAR